MGREEEVGYRWDYIHIFPCPNPPYPPRPKMRQGLNFAGQFLCQPLGIIFALSKTRPGLSLVQDMCQDIIIKIVLSLI